MSESHDTLFPYGDTRDDSVVQLSFTLPIENGARAMEAARVLARKMGFREAELVHARSVGKGFTFFIIYGKGLVHGVALDEIIVRDLGLVAYEFEEANQIIRDTFRRRLVVVGACIGTDTHTLGIDAILNVKGYHGHSGLERYPEVSAHNLGSQVSAAELLRNAVELNADAVLVSQVVTQKGLHIKTLTEFIELAEGFGVRQRMLLVAGGPGITNRLALELGFDAGFGRGTYAEDVLTFCIKKLQERSAGRL